MSNANDTAAAPLYVIVGTGSVGLTLAEEFLSHGERIRLVSRSGPAASWAHASDPNVEIRRGDITDLAFAAEVGGGATVVVNCLNPPYHKWPELWPGMHAGMIAAAEANGARMVVLDNVYGYGNTKGAPMTEDSPIQATTRKGGLRGGLDIDLLGRNERGEMEVALVRASDFIGPRGEGSVIGATVYSRMVAGQTAQFLGDPDQPHDYTYIPDVARALRLVAVADGPVGGTWHVPSPPTKTSREIVKEVAERLNRPAKIQVLPTFLFWILTWFSSLMREIWEMRYQFTQPFYVHADKMRDRFDFQPTDWATIQDVTIAWYQEQASTTGANARSDLE